MSGNIRQDNAEKRKSLNMKLAQLDGLLQKINNAVAEEGKENTLWDLTEKLVLGFNYVPYTYRKFNPVAKRRILNFLFLNLQLNGKKLRVQAIPEFEKLKLVNYLLQSEKLLLNYQPNAEKPLKKAFPKMETALSYSNLQYGGPSWT